MTRILVAAAALLALLWILGRHAPAEPAPETFWRDLERVESV